MKEAKFSETERNISAAMFKESPKLGCGFSFKTLLNIYCVEEKKIRLAVRWSGCGGESDEERRMFRIRFKFQVPILDRIPTTF